MSEITTEAPKLTLQGEAIQRVQHLFDNVRMFSQIRGFKVEDTGAKISGSAAGLKFTLIDNEDKSKTVKVVYNKLRSMIDGIDSDEYNVSQDIFEHTQKLTGEKNPRFIDSNTSSHLEIQASFDRLSEITDDIIQSP